MTERALLLATLDTKRREADCFRDILGNQGIIAQIVDVSLTHTRRDKIRTIERVGAQLGARVREMLNTPTGCVIGLCGGTGADIIFRIMRCLPHTMPKLMVTPLPFDPRAALAEDSIIIVPTMVDIVGLNATLRQAYATAAAVAVGLCRAGPARCASEQPSIAVTSLGATAGAVDQLVESLAAGGDETTVFHANGFGGAAFARFVETGACRAVIDLTCHELTRSLFAGSCTPMPTRFTAAGHLPRVVLPGALNFLGFGPIDTVPPCHLERPHYRHAAHFTHVKLTCEEMAQAASTLATHLNAATAPTHVIVPMGGFSHRDCPGGEIEDADLRRICRDILDQEAIHYTFEVTPDHINDARTVERIMAALAPHVTGDSR